MEVVYALVVALFMNGDIKHVLVSTKDMQECKELVAAFVEEPLAPKMRDARISCVSSKVDPMRGTRAA